MTQILTNILNNISALQSGKIDKTAIVQHRYNDTTKVPSSAVTYGLGQQIDTINNNLEYIAGMNTLHVWADSVLLRNRVVLLRTCE